MFKFIQKLRGAYMSQAPKLNKNQKFSTNMASAHELMLLGKQGKKGNQSVARYALPAFNVTTYQGIDAAVDAFQTLGASGIVAFSNSALKHFGNGDAIKGLARASEHVKMLAKEGNVKIATHLDHGDYLSDSGKKVVDAAIECLTSVMADNSTDHKNETHTPLEVNIEATRAVVDKAHAKGVSVEGELGVLAGVEDEDTQSEVSTYTDPEELKDFLTKTGVLMLAPTIGTMHGPNKGKPGQKVKLNIELANECLKIADKINSDIIFVAHGASTLYPNVIEYAVNQLKDMGTLAEATKKWNNFVGTDWDQIEGLIKAGFCKINTDTENRQTYLAALLGAVKAGPATIDIRNFDKVTYKALYHSYLQKLIMAGNYGVWHEPKIDVKNFKFTLS
ncbi:MAG: class II fructose-bisphosphate aldolase [Bacteriovoracaceae bacterium]|nr:class II fructose-bisphosphate aldolase [Bacteriovoracaceae bacterium]